LFAIALSAKGKNIMKSAFAILLFCIAQIGCGSSNIASSSPHDKRLSFSQFNRDAKGKKSTIVLRDGVTIDAQEVQADPDSTAWLHQVTGGRATVPTHKIRKVVFTNRTLGAFQGAGVGLLAGAGAGLVLGAIAYSSLRDPDPPDPALGAFVLLPAIGGGGGLVIGGIIGVVKGSRGEYEFSNDMEKPSD
jgi:hypothetical protein